MSTLKGYITADRIEEFARPSNIKYGTAIYKRGGVEVINKSSTMIKAKVGGLDGSVSEGGSQRRTTQLHLKDGSLTWQCTESAKPDLIFCKHCVALALEVLNNS